MWKVRDKVCDINTNINKLRLHWRKYDDASLKPTITLALMLSLLRGPSLLHSRKHIDKPSLVTSGAHDNNVIR
jgi:hypothetical protein